ncbi:response regulator transcription factor [Bdellovibrio bacteriovorus]|uniref:response regulator transcription factor n=1 Tax=Bdellovibrio bacteriovorus TaxID=959 RepID=UPI003AA977A0
MNSPVPILAIDDDLSFLKSLSTALQARYRLHCAANLEQARQILKEQSIQAILLDFNLGNETGHEVLKALNTDPQRPPVIVVTGEVTVKMAIGFLNLQVFGFLEKPLSLSDLLRLLESAISTGTQSDIIKGRHFELDLKKRTVRYKDEDIVLTQTQSQIVSFFIRHRGTTVERERLIQHLWGESHVSRNALDTHLLNIKNKLPPFRTSLQVIHGRGYCYED